MQSAGDDFALLWTCRKTSEPAIDPAPRTGNVPSAQPVAQDLPPISQMRPSTKPSASAASIATSSKTITMIESLSSGRAATLSRDGYRMIAATCSPVPFEFDILLYYGKNISAVIRYYEKARQKPLSVAQRHHVFGRLAQRLGAVR